MKTLIDIQKEIWEEKRKYFENIDFYLPQIKEIVKKILGENVRILLFGSIVKKNWTSQSDIDLLVISDSIPKDLEENLKIKTKIKSSFDPFSPLQIHLATSEEFEHWYKKFIKDEYQEI